MSIQVIYDWWMKWWLPQKCGICEGSLTKNYGKICYHAYQDDAPPKLEYMHVCSTCLDTLEAQHRAFTQTVEDWKRENEFEDKL